MSELDSDTQKLVSMVAEQGNIEIIRVILTIQNNTITDLKERVEYLEQEVRKLQNDCS